MVQLTFTPSTADLADGTVLWAVAVAADGVDIGAPYGGVAPNRATAEADIEMFVRGYTAQAEKVKARMIADLERIAVAKS